VAASPGAVQAMGPTMVAGAPLSRYENDTSQHVAMIDITTAAALGLSPARLASQPAVFVDGIAYTVVGVYSSAQRVVTDESAMLIPENTALADFGNPEPGIGNQDEAQMVVATRIGAAQAVARELAAAERPADPSRLVVTSPPNPQNLQGQVTGDLAGLFLVLASIGLRRAVGARPRHIAAQFLAESTALGTLGGLIGTCIGVGDRGDLRRGQGLDGRAEPGIYAARAADRQRRRPAGRRLSSAARRADQPARGAAARVSRGTPERNEDAYPHRPRPADLLLHGPVRLTISRRWAPRSGGTRPPTPRNLASSPGC